MVWIPKVRSVWAVLAVIIRFLLTSLNPGPSTGGVLRGRRPDRGRDRGGLGVIQMGFAQMIGKTFSHYKIIEKLGEGGMGVVYKAQDTKLKRNVALKFLPPALTRDSEAKERFIHEARAASALDHSNICTIHEIDETEDGRMFIAMACYEGETLKERVKRGPLELGESIEIAIEVARGLAKAHAEEIIHRDIKPANIHITKDGQVKILDFGLAKLAGQTKLTKTGTTLGTVAYMSPEQARGEEIDSRSDIWSLGAILYEMVTGRLPFRSEHEQAVLYSILNEDPEPVGALRPECPREIARVIGKALAKSREDRYERVEELIADLKGEKYRTSTLGAVRPAQESFISRRTGFLMVAIVAAMVVTILVTVLVLDREPVRHVVPTRSRLTFVGRVTDCAISPDGSHIAYVEEQNEERRRVMVQELDGGQAIEVLADKWTGDVQWSPDSKELLVTVRNDSTTGACIVPRLGGAHRRYPSPGWCCCWSPDGTRFATAGLASRIQVVDRNSGPDSTITVEGPFDWINSIDWSPSGEFLAISTAGSEEAGIWLLREDGSDLVQLIDDRAYPVIWSARGDAIYYLRSTGEVDDLVKLSVDPVSGVPRGEPVLLLTDVDAPFTITEDAGLLLHLQKTRWSNLWLVDLDGSGSGENFTTKELTTGTSYIMDPSVSPDGGFLAFSKSVGDESQVFTMPVDGGTATQLTHGTGLNGSPVWSPDGRLIAYVSFQSEDYGLFVVDAGGGVPRRFPGRQVSWDLAWTPGNKILYQEPGNKNFRVLDPDSEEEFPLPLGDARGWMFDAKNSPDGKRVAICWNRYSAEVERTVQSLWVIGLDDSSQVQASTMDLDPLGWSQDGEWIYAMFSYSPVFCRVPSGGGEVDTLAILPFDDIWEVALSPKTQKLICSRGQWQSDVWLIENFDPDVE